MKLLCIHLEHGVVQIPVPPQIEWVITTEFVDHLKKKWPDLHCHLIIDDDVECIYAKD